MIITLPWPPADLSPNARNHWAVMAKAKKKYRRDCGQHAIAQGARKMDVDSIHAEITFYPPSKRRMDKDNCIASMKSGIDGIADVIGVDDSRWDMSFELAGSDPPGRVVVELSTIPHLVSP